MGRYLSILFLIISAFNCAAQGDSTISFVAYWNKGDSKKYKVTKIEKRVKGKEIVKDNVQSYLAKLTVIDSTETSYTIKWSYENSLLRSTPIPDEFQPIMEKFRFLNIDYETDEYGEFIGITNWQELSKLMIELFDEMPKMLGEDSLNIMAAIEPFKQLYSSKEGIESYISKELLYLHWPFGLQYSIYDTLTYNESLPNMLGGDPITGLGKIYFDSVNFESNYCRFINTLSLDQEDAKKMVTTNLEKMISRMTFDSKQEKKEKVSEMREVFSKMRMDINDYNIFEYDYYPGWPKTINIKRVTEIQSAEEVAFRTDQILIEEVE